MSPSAVDAWGRLERVQAFIDLGRLDNRDRPAARRLGYRPDDAAALCLLAACHLRAGRGRL